MFNEHLCPVFRALADPRRLWYVEALAYGDLRFGELAEMSALSQQAVLHHLKVLQECGLQVSRKEGRVRLYTLQPEGLRQAYDWMQRVVWSAYRAEPGSPLRVQLRVKPPTRF